MLANISPLITRGVIDNTTEGLVDLRLWCSDGLEPLHFRMKGNSLRDIAGCRVDFTNRSTTQARQTPDLITDLRQGVYHVNAGDITLSRRSPERDNRASLCNWLSIELFANEAIRLLIESSDFTYDISLPQWQQTWAGDNMQRMLNMEELRTHIRLNVKRYRGSGMNGIGKEVPHCEWDDKLNKAEAYMAIYPTIHEKYNYEPGGYLAAAFVLDRVDFLGKEAKEEEAHMPPDTESLNHDWAVLDFLHEEDIPSVRRAMRHPLFRAAAQMSAVIQEDLIKRENIGIDQQKLTDIIDLYASIVTQLLATILLTQERSFSVRLATARLEGISNKLEQFTHCCEDLPAPLQASVHHAATRLAHGMKDFHTSLSQ